MTVLVRTIMKNLKSQGKEQVLVAVEDVPEADQTLCFCISTPDSYQVKQQSRMLCPTHV